MGRCHRASVLVCGPTNVISFKNYYSSLKLVGSKIIFVLSCHNITELFKNSVKKVKQKFALAICYFPHPFSRQQYQNAPLSDISPFKFNRKQPKAKVTSTDPELI
jgi:hypothetical protein